MQERFWQHKSLGEMNPHEWESLCDGCGLCCLVKLEQEDGQVVSTRASCKLLDVMTCGCSDYEHRVERVPSCLRVTPDNAGSLDWIPDTCAYRLLAQGKPLPEWHPLVTGDPESVHEAGISARGRVVSEEHVHPDDLIQLRW